MKFPQCGLGLAIALAALCASGAPAAPPPAADERGPCDSPDKRAWRRLPSPPADADALATLATTKPSFSVPQHWVAETWFALGDAILLCRSDAPLTRACSGEWWRFEPAAAGGRALADHDSFLCLAEAAAR
jgi:hypothetical protein